MLRDIALETRTMRQMVTQPPAQQDSHLVTVEVDGWVLELRSASGSLAHCSACQSPDGRSGSDQTWQRYGTDPVQLLSTWELEQVSRLLNALK